MFRAERNASAPSDQAEVLVWFISPVQFSSRAEKFAIVLDDQYFISLLSAQNKFWTGDESVYKCSFRFRTMHDWQIKPCLVFFMSAGVPLHYLPTTPLTIG